MKRRLSNFILLAFIFAFAFTAVANAQFARKDVKTLSNSVILTYTASIDSGATVTSENFTFGHYDFTTYPVYYETIVTSHNSNKPKITTYLDISYDNVNWELKQDTLATSDSVLTLHHGTTQFNKLKAPYYRLTSVRKDTTAGKADLKWIYFIKKE
jgi:hypothetical protein